MSLTDCRQRTLTRERPRLRGAAWVAYLRADARYLLGVTIGTMLITSLPVAFGYASAPDDRWFSGLVYNVHDAAQYLSWMREAGRTLFAQNLLTSEPNPAVFLNLHWWIPGRLGALAGLSLPGTFQLYRLLAIPILIVALWLFCRLAFIGAAPRRFCLALTLATSGLGWIWVVEKYVSGRADMLHPLDVHGLSGNVFWTAMSSPHLTLAVGLLVATLAVALVGSEAAGLRPSLLAGGLALLLGLGHIYDLVTVWAVLGVYGLVTVLRHGWSTRLFLRLFAVVATSAPAVGYWGWVSSEANPIWKQALGQYDNLACFTPSPPHLAVFLGITFFAALPALFLRLPPRGDGRIWTLIACWFVTTLVLVYLPFPFQITLLAGYPLPMAALATRGLFDGLLPWLRGRLARRGRMAGLWRWVPMVLLLAVLPTNVYLLAWRVVDLNRHTYPYYLHRDDRAAMAWIEAEAPPEAVVLSSFTIGHYLPGLTGRRAYLSNAVMTVDFVRKRALVEAFFDARTPDAWRRELMRAEGVDYLFFGPAEAAGASYDPATSGLFAVVFDGGQTRVYALR